MTNTIFFDVDGVLLNLKPILKPIASEYFGHKVGTIEYMKLCLQFKTNPKSLKDFSIFIQEHELFSKLPVMKGMQEVVSNLKSKGYKINIITAATPTKKTVENRTKNLKSCFGENIFDEVYFTSGSKEKKEILSLVSKYNQTTFIDDTLKTVEDCSKIIDNPIYKNNSIIPYKHFDKKIKVASNPMQILSLIKQNELQR